jgi:hypothetical protein
MHELLDALFSPTTDRRRERRFQTTFGTVCHLHRGGREYGSGLVWDISATGVGLLVPFAPKKGSAFNVTLATEDGGASLTLPIRVAHVRQLSTGDYFVGGEFARTLTPDEIEAFITPESSEPTPPTQVSSTHLTRTIRPRGTSSWFNRVR